MFRFCSLGYRAGMAKPDDRDRILFDLCLALRAVPKGTLRDLGKQRLPGDELAEKVAATLILEHLERAGWRLEHHPGKLISPAK